MSSILYQEGCEPLKMNSNLPGICDWATHTHTQSTDGKTAFMLRAKHRPCLKLE